MSKKLVPSSNLTLEAVRKADYWELIAIVVWNHYREKRFQRDEDVRIYEDFYGKSEDGSSMSYSSSWNDEKHSSEGYIRTLGSIVIKHIRSDYTTYIYINVETGDIFYFGKYASITKRDKNPNYHCRAIDLMNWMLNNNFLEITATMTKGDVVECLTPDGWESGIVTKVTKDKVTVLLHFIGKEREFEINQVR